MNLTKEIIDETSILYKETPIYKVVDSKGKSLPNDQKLWEEVMDHSRYLMTMEKTDRWTKLLGTVLIKVSFIDENTGFSVKENVGGKVQLDVMHGGVYDIRHGASPYYITELLIGFGTKFGGFAGLANQGKVATNIPPTAGYGDQDIGSKNSGKQAPNAQSPNMIYWSPDKHKVINRGGEDTIVDNPYGMIPAVPFFNSDPAHYYFLPINEPLIYANHATNMRITDLNHIAKFQSFGVPVLTGVERPTGTRQGRPSDDAGILRGGLAQSRFGGLVGGGTAASGNFRNFDSGFGAFRDGNADANALGFSIGPDTAIAVGEKGDFKFEHPKADITGLLKTIESITDMVRVNHGLMPKYKDKMAPSGFALWMDKAGVIDQNRRRGQLFNEREQQLFQVIKKLWNTHYSKSGDKKFSEDAKLEITYVEPKFPVDPKTQMETIIMELKIRQSGDTQAFKQLYPYMTDSEIAKLLKTTRKDASEQAHSETDTQLELADKYDEKGFDSPDMNKSELDVSGSKIDNRAKHSEGSSIQPGKNGDGRGAPRGNSNRTGGKGKKKTGITNMSGDL